MFLVAARKEPIDPVASIKIKVLIGYTAGPGLIFMRYSFNSFDLVLSI
jgi:hypothetical protein